MNREDDLKNLWAELRATTEAKEDKKEEPKKEENYIPRRVRRPLRGRE